MSHTLTSMPGTINLVASVSQNLTPTPTIVNRAQIVPPFPLTSVAGGVAGGGIGFILILVLVVIIIVMCKKNSAKSYQTLRHWGTPHLKTPSPIKTQPKSLSKPTTQKKTPTTPIKIVDLTTPPSTRSMPFEACKLKHHYDNRINRSIPT